MCEALLELMKDELEESKKAGRIEREKAGRIAGERSVKINLTRTKLSKGKTIEAIAEDFEDSVENILTLIKEMDKKEENK